MAGGRDSEEGRGRGRGSGRGQKRKPIRLELSTSTSPACSAPPSGSGSDVDGAPLPGRGGGLPQPSDFVGLVYLGRGPKILPPHKMLPMPSLTATEVAAHQQQRQESFLVFANAASVMAARVSLPRCTSAMLLTPEELFVRTRARLSRGMKRDCKDDGVEEEVACTTHTCK